MKHKTKRPERRWISVFETKGQRRHPDKPSVIVRRTIIRPGPELDAWLHKSKKLRKQQATRVLYNLMPSPEDPGGRDNPYTLPRQNVICRDAITDLAKALRSQGYTVGKDLTTWHLYVIELRTPRRPRKRHTGHLYVGQTSIAIEERIEQHRLGPAYPWKRKPIHSKDCHKDFVQPRLDLIPKCFQQTYFSEEAALVAESDLRLYFEDLGYMVKGGNERYKQQTALR